MRVLLITEPRRVDLYQFLQHDTKNEYYILWKDAKLFNPTKPDFVAECFSWEEFNSPTDILNKLQPAKIVFYEIIDVLQIALCITANYKNIPTLFIDHGLKPDSMEAFFAFYDSQPQITVNEKLKSAGTHFFSGLRNRMYYLSCINKIRAKNIVPFLRLMVQLQLMHPMKALQKNNFDERTPNQFILFCKHNITLYQYYYFIQSKIISIVGNPQYDEFKIELKNETKQDPYIVYIDADYLESDVYGWDKNFHQKVARNLEEFAVSEKIKMHIKLHPRSNEELWAGYNLNSEYITILKQGNFIELYLKAELILAHYTSLLMGLVPAQKNIVLLGWRPSNPQVAGTDFDKYDLMHQSMYCEDLKEKYSYWILHNKTLLNQKQFLDFLVEFNTPFDGKATQRIIDIFSK